jgi:yecA family protein
MNNVVSFEEIQDALTHSDVSGTAAEAHGLLSGMLCMDVATDCHQWLGDFFGAELSEIQGEDRLLLDRLYQQTRRQLVDFDFSFGPLLPDDEDSLENRAQALGEWCHGFLQGIGYTGKQSGWPGEMNEILADLLEIVRLDPAAAGEGDESAYTELTEYVRVGVQVIHSELQSQTPPQHH